MNFSCRNSDLLCWAWVGGKRDEDKMKNYTLGNKLTLRLFFEQNTVLPTSPFSQNRIWCFDKLAIEILQSELSYVFEKGYMRKLMKFGQVWMTSGKCNSDCKSTLHFVFSLVIRTWERASEKLEISVRYPENFSQLWHQFLYPICICRVT